MKFKIILVNKYYLYLVGVICILSLAGCSDVVMISSPSIHKKRPDTQLIGCKQNTIEKIACYAQRINVMPIEYRSKTEQNHQSFNNFTQNFDHELTHILDIIRHKAQNCSLYHKNLTQHNPKEHVIYNVYIYFEYYIKNAEVGSNAYSHSSQIIFKIHYDIKDDKNIISRQIITHADIIHPKSGFAYFLSLEDIDNNVASNMAHTIILKVLNDVVNQSLR